VDAAPPTTSGIASPAFSIDLPDEGRPAGHPESRFSSEDVIMWLNLASDRMTMLEADRFCAPLPHRPLFGA
jgi:hypothetical protein